MLGDRGDLGEKIRVERPDNITCLRRPVRSAAEERGQLVECDNIAGRNVMMTLICPHIGGLAFEP